VTQSSADRILDAAIEMIECGGEAAVRVNDLAIRSGLAVTAVYHYYGDRDGLIAAAQAARYIRNAREFMAQHIMDVRNCQSREELRAYLHSFLREVFSAERAPARWVRVNVLGSSYARPALQRALSDEHNRMFGEIEKLWTEVQARGFINPTVDPVAIGPWYMSVITGRVLIEIPGSNVDVRAWDTLMLQLLDSFFFGERAD
jgi:AcrR family transcriptional regulator